MKRRGFKRLMDAHPWLCNWALIPSLFKLGGFFHQLQQGQDFRAVWFSSLAKTAMKRCVFLSQVRATEVVQLPVFVSFVVKQQIPPTHYFLIQWGKRHHSHHFRLESLASCPKGESDQIASAPASFNAYMLCNALQLDVTTRPGTLSRAPQKTLFLFTLFLFTLCSLFSLYK